MNTITVEIPVTHRLTVDAPREVPAGRTILAFTQPPAVGEPGGYSPRTVAEALSMAATRAADPNRKPVSRHFGKHKGIFGSDGVAY
jgi:hypothetical protein